MTANTRQFFSVFAWCASFRCQYRKQPFYTPSLSSDGQTLDCSFFFFFSLFSPFPVPLSHFGASTSLVKAFLFPYFFLCLLFRLSFFLFFFFFSLLFPFSASLTILSAFSSSLACRCCLWPRAAVPQEQKLLQPFWRPSPNLRSRIGSGLPATAARSLP